MLLRRVALAVVVVLSFAILVGTPALASVRPPAAIDDGPPGEVERIREHLARVEAGLRARDTRGLPPAIAAARARNLDRLHAYWTAGRFPHNHDFPGRRVPYFIDAHGTACAVAQLVIASGDAALAERIARTRNHAYVPEMKDDAELAAWAARSGLTLDELAWIQPTYDMPELRCARYCAEPPPLLARWNGERLERFEQPRACTDRPLPADDVPSPRVPETCAGDVRRIWVAAEDVIWGVGPEGVYRWAGAGWEHIHDARGLKDVWGTRDVVYVAGERTGRLERSVVWGYAWSDVPLERWASGRSGAVWGAGDEIWIADESGLVVGHLIRGALVPTGRPAEAHAQHASYPPTLSGSGARDVWLSRPWGADSVVHYDGSTWSTRPLPVSRSWEQSVVWGAADDDAWAIVRGGILLWDGSAWTRSFVTESVGSIWSGGGAAWAVGSEALRWDGATWQKVPTGLATWWQVRGLGPAAVWLLPNPACRNVKLDSLCVAKIEARRAVVREEDPGDPWHRTRRWIRLGVLGAGVLGIAALFVAWRRRR
jgi:hypothetical protein